MQNVKFIPKDTLKKKYDDASKLSFGREFTDYMLTVRYEAGKGWHDAKIEPYGDFTMDPACMVLHYGQTIFEGLKAYHTADNRVLLFRPWDNFKRFAVSATRLDIPPLDVEFGVESLKQLIAVEKDWIPQAEGTSLYIRPTIIATDPYLGVKSSDTYLYYVILSPVGAYYPQGFQPVKIYVEDEYVRAVKGGMGFVKTGGNYAASLLAGAIAKKKGYNQVLWLDGVERKYIEEVGAMNMFFVFDDEIATPMLNGSILSGITRDSVLQLGKSKGLNVKERRISIEEVYERSLDGTLKEAFGTGTAAVISPVSELRWGEDKIITINDGKTGPVAQDMYDTLLDIQYGRAVDTFGWTTEVK